MNEKSGSSATLILILSDILWISVNQESDVPKKKKGLSDVIWLLTYTM